MQTKADVQAHVLEYMRTHNLSESEMARRVGVPQATLNRMLADSATYRGTPEPWRQLARFKDFRWDEAEVLAAVGLGPPVQDGDADPWQLLEAAMRGFRLKERYRSHLRQQIEFLLQAHQVEPQNGN